MRNIVSRALFTLMNEGPISFLRKTRRRLQTRSGEGFKPYVIRKTLYGETFPYVLGDPVGEDWFTAFRENPEMDWLKEHVRPGDVVLVCGAHHGMFSLFLSRWVGEAGRVICYEGLPANAEILRRNVDLGGHKNMEVRAAAVTDRSGTVHFKDASNGYIAADGLEVPAVALDDAWDKADVLFVDVESFELSVLRGARKLLRGPLKRLDIEVHCIMFDRPVEEITAIFAEIPKDFRLEVQLDPSERPIPYDSALHTPQRLARLPRVNLFGMRE
ncbi:MAG: FkbM family methyltransferase [Acidobacteriales bacterium]|nr:FkbM family methyltransferase [Terriglobales bacterium]